MRLYRRSLWKKHVLKLSTEFVPRNGSHLGNINRTADYILSEFRAIGKGQANEPMVRGRKL